jgi:hypothetical protein
MSRWSSKAWMRPLRFVGCRADSEPEGTTWSADDDDDDDETISRAVAGVHFDDALDAESVSEASAEVHLSEGGENKGRRGSITALAEINTDDDDDDDDDDASGDMDGIRGMVSWCGLYVVIAIALFVPLSAASIWLAFAW